MSLPSTFIAEVLVSQPVTQSTWPVSTGDMSAPSVTICTSLSGILFLASSARSRMMPVAWIPTFLPIKSFGSRMGFFFNEKNA